MSFTVLTVGDLVADVVVALPQLPLEIGQYQEAYFVRLEPGGAGNFLIAGARLGLAENGGGFHGLEEAACVVTLLEKAA